MEDVKNFVVVFLADYGPREFALVFITVYMAQAIYWLFRKDLKRFRNWLAIKALGRSVKREQSQDLDF